MEVGAVKQAFNNELILIKRNLNQARIQIIHKLTRKAKTFVEKKGPEKIKEKFKRKAEAAVNEVLILKKIKPKDLAKFIVTHKEELQTYLNKPTVDQDKACARLLLHKSLQDKYKFIRDRFSTVPIEDLLMSREERKKLKKEAREKQKNKKKGKDNNVVNAEGEWDVEDVEMTPEIEKNSDDELSSDEEGATEEEKSLEDDDEKKLSENDSDEIEDNDAVMKESGFGSNDDNEVNKDEVSDDGNSSSDDEEKASEVGKFVKVTLSKPAFKPNNKVSDKKHEFMVTPKVDRKPENKSKDRNKPNKNKNLNDKLLSRKFKKDVNETPVQETKVVDPFFITSTGENYMSVAEPRLPDEIKEEHKQGNRKHRRAVMFGHVPKIKPRRHDIGPDNRFSKNNNGFNKNDSLNNFNDRKSHNDKWTSTDKKANFNRNTTEPKPDKVEKLHPSWEAKKKQSGILPFQGKKIVFDES